MRTCRADISDWIEQDYDAVMQYASAQMQNLSPHLPLFVIGHSLGGQTLPLLPSLPTLSNFAGAINIAVGSGAMRHNVPALRRNAPLLWYLFAPLLCPLFGYFPGSKIGVIGDIPTRALFQWRRWCLTPDYLLSGEPGARDAYARAQFELLALTISDDELLLESGDAPGIAPGRSWFGAYRPFRFLQKSQPGRAVATGTGLVAAAWGQGSAGGLIWGDLLLECMLYSHLVATFFRSPPCATSSGFTVV
jgi:hypothetical protein